MKEIIFEWGLNSLLHFLNNNEEFNSIIEIESYILNKYEQKLKIIPYISIKSSLSGGRTGDFDFSDVKKNINDLNKLGIPVNLTYNGGILNNIIDNESIKHELKNIKLLSVNNDLYNLDNSVTVLLHDFNNAIKNTYSNVKTIASCITQLFPNKKIDIPFLFKNYDFVVLLNQFCTIEYLLKYKEYSKKMILFLFVHCQSNDLYQCYLHYLILEFKKQKKFNKHIDIISKNEYLNQNIKLFPPNTCLNERPKEIIKLLSIGINKFKIPKYVTKKFSIELSTIDDFFTNIKKVKSKVK